MENGEAVRDKVVEVEIPGARIEILDEPYVMIPNNDPSASLKVLAHTVGNEGESSIAGYVATKPGHATILAEFSGKPTGYYKPCNAVQGYVGEGQVFSKNVYTDTPLSGLRTAVAQHRAARAVKRNLR